MLTAARRGLVAGAIGIAAIAATGCAADPPAAVVGLTVTGCPPGTANGTGIVVEPGLILTSAHVVKGANEITITNGAKTTTGTIVAFDPNMDLAYLRVDADFARPVELAGTRPGDGEQGSAYVFRDGRVEVIPVTVRRAIRLRTEDIYIEGDTDRPAFELDADIRAGDSGGPVVVDGEVIAVVALRSSKYEARAYAIDPVSGGSLVRQQLGDGTIGPDIDLERCT